MSAPNGVPPSGTTDPSGYAAVPTNEPPVTTEQSPQEHGTAATVNADITTILDEVVEEAQVVVPPDGGWGWVVVAASFMCNMIVDGTIFSFGMFLPHIKDSFGASKAETTLVGSLMSGFYMMTGPFVSALANRYGFRLVAILGSVVGVAAFVLSYYSTSVSYLYLSYGILGGIGFGLIYVPAVIIVGYYFEKYRALATGISVCGSGIGTFLFAPLSAMLIEKLGWRGALLVQAAIVSSCLFIGMLFRPVTPTKVKDLQGPEEKPELVMDSSKLPPETRIKMESALKHIANSRHSLYQSQGTLNKILGANNNADYPTVADVYHTITVPNQQKSKAVAEKRLSVPYIKDADKPLLSNKGSNPVIVPSGRRPSWHRTRTTSDAGHVYNMPTTVNKGRRGSEVNRPLYRDDIFFGASLTRLPQYQSQSSLAYNLSVTRLPTKADIDEEEKRACKMCPEAVRRTLATMLDFSLFKSIPFMMLAVSGFLTMMGFFVPFMYIVNRQVMQGWNEDSAMWLLSTIGIANTIGRVLCGTLSFFPKIQTLWVNNIAISIGGIATFLSGFSNSQEYQYFYCIVFGLSISTFASLRPILVVEFIGLEKLTNGYGLLLLFQGAAAAIGAPLAGAFMDATGSYDASFYLSGGLMFISAVICYPLNWVNEWEKRRSKGKSVPI